MSSPLHDALTFVQSAARAKIRLEHGARDMCGQDCMGKTSVSMATLNGRHNVLEALCHRSAPSKQGVGEQHR